MSDPSAAIKLPTVPGNAHPLLEKLGLHRPELRAWAAYDWANSAMVTVIVSTVFPIYYLKVAAVNLDSTLATSRFSAATTLSLLLVAVVAPFLGALADSAPVKKVLLGFFLAVGAASTAAMFLIQHGDWELALILFVLADIGACGSFIFYDALLRHVAHDEEMDRVSTSAYALGYLGGGLLLTVNILWIQHPELFGLPHGPDLTAAQTTLPTRLAFVSVSAWWLVFALPLFFRVSEPALTNGSQPGLTTIIGSSVRRMMNTFRDLREYRQALLMLLAFLAYNDGIGTIIRLAAIYGAEIGIEGGSLIASILIVQFVGIPCSIGFGMLAGRIGTKTAIYGGLIVYLGITVLAYFLQTATQFFVLAVLVGLVQGGTQALSRSLFASLIPKRESTGFFAFFSLSEKFAGILGPMFFTATVYLTGSSRNGILSVIAFFLVGGYLLSLVDVEEGRRFAQEKDNSAPR